MLLQGILLGLSLSFLIGPLLFAIVEAGIGQGFRAGVAVATGIWASDLLFMLLAIFGVGALDTLAHLTGFRLWSGVVGGSMLMIFGLTSLWKKRADTRTIKRAIDPQLFREKSYPEWCLRGFLLNTINPGTLFFWFGIVSGVVAPSGWARHETLIFFSGMMAALVFTDTLKAWAAKRLRRFLTPAHILQVQRIIGMLLFIFGVVLALRALLQPE